MLKFASELEEGGFTPQQARTAAKAFAGAATDELATKHDTAGVKSEISAVRSDFARIESVMATKSELAAVKSDIARIESVMATKADLADTKAELMKWMFGLIGFQTVIILGSVIALARAFH